MKISLISKIIISNLIVLLFSLATFGIIYNFEVNERQKILFERKQIASFRIYVSRVSVLLYKSGSLHEDKYLADAGNVSLKAISALTFLKQQGYQVDEVERLYLEFFRNTVMTTSLLLEEKLIDAQISDKISSQAQLSLRQKLQELITVLDKEEECLQNNIFLLMGISSIILILLVVGNIKYLIKSYKDKEEKEKEKELKRVEIEAIEQRAAMIDALGDGVYGIDNEGICTFVNQSASELLGYSKDEILNQHQHYLFHHHHIDNSEYLEVDCPIHKTTHDKHTRNCTEYFIKKDGTMFPVALTVAPTSDGAVVVFRDISEVKNYEEKLKIEVAQKTQELQELNNSLEDKIELALDKNKKQQAMLEQQSRLAALGEMIGNIAHQWRQPLSVITSTISSLAVKQDYGIEITKEMISETTNSIVQQANYLSKTIDDFRDFIKNDNTEELFSLSKVIYDTTNILNATLKSNHIELFTDLDESITYKGYPNQLSQAILNIINNAKDAFKNQENDNKYLKIITKRIKDKIVIEISDNAGGIPKVIREKIFDPYFTTKHQSQGTGLGLYVSANIIQKYFNGKINVDDFKENVDKGTTFIIEIV